MRCPHCCKSLGGASPEGGFRVRLAITLLDPEDGRVHGPCPFCKADVTVADGADLVKALIEPRRPKVQTRRRIIRLGLPITASDG